MSNYDCPGCGNYAGNCECYHHHKGPEERKAWEAYQEAYREAENTFRDYMRGYSYGPVEEKVGGYGYARKAPPELSDFEELKSKANRLNAEYESLHKLKYEEGRAKHEARKLEIELENKERKRVESARERAIERLIREELENEAKA